MISSIHLNFLYACSIFGIIILVTWYFVRKSPANSHSRKVMGHQLISAATWFVIADLALLIFIPDIMNWMVNIGLLGLAVISYIVGAKILNSYQEDDEEDCEELSENAIVVYYRKADNNYCASLSDNVPGAVVFTADTFEELIKEADRTIQFHIEGMIKDGDDVPEWLANGDYNIEFVEEESK